MNIYDTFTSNPDCVQVIDGNFEAFHPSGECVDQAMCRTCVFKNEAETCVIKPNHKDFQPIYDFFQAHYPEKLL